MDTQTQIQALQAQVASNPGDLDLLERLDLALNLAGRETQAEETRTRLVGLWRAERNRFTTWSDGIDRLDWVRLKGNDGSAEATLTQFYEPQPHGPRFTWYNEIRVTVSQLNNVPAGTPRLFRLESGASSLYFLREYFTDGGGCTHKNYGSTRPRVRQLFDDALAVVNGSGSPHVTFRPGGRTQLPGSALLIDPSTVTPTDIMLHRLEEAASKIAANGAAGAATLKILKRYIGALALCPEDPKYRRINTQNSHYRSKVQPHQAARKVLRLVGFQPSREEGGTFLVLEPTDNNVAFWRAAVLKLESAIGN